MSLHKGSSLFTGTISEAELGSLEAGRQAVSVKKNTVNPSSAEGWS